MCGDGWNRDQEVDFVAKIGSRLAAIELKRLENDLWVVVPGHFFFVYIHPYMDGNGRMGRFLMNLLMASGGYPWTIVPLERRKGYMSALESASVAGDIKPFARFLAELARGGAKTKQT